MQLITALVRPFKVRQICDALERFGFRGLTVSEVTATGTGPTHSKRYRGSTFTSDSRQRAKIEIVARDCDALDLVSVIRTVAWTGRSGDGTVWTTPVVYLVRIRTGESGVDAV